MTDAELAAAIVADDRRMDLERAARAELVPWGFDAEDMADDEWTATADEVLEQAAREFWRSKGYRVG